MFLSYLVVTCSVFGCCLKLLVFFVRNDIREMLPYSAQCLALHVMRQFMEEFRTIYVKVDSDPEVDFRPALWIRELTALAGVFNVSHMYGTEQCSCDACKLQRLEIVQALGWTSVNVHVDALWEALNMKSKVTGVVHGCEECVCVVADGYLSHKPCGPFV